MKGRFRRPRVRTTHAVELELGRRDQVEARRAEAIRLVDGDALAERRVAAAPAGYVLAHNSSDIARQCQLLSPVPAPGEARVVITPTRAPGAWHLDVGSRDRRGLLAAYTGVLADRGIDVQQAVLATWTDGGALEAFIVTSAEMPEPDALEAAFAGALDRPLWSPAIENAEISFVNDRSPLYTTCDVRAVDRPGLLHAIAVAIASAGADVHAASVTTIDGIVHDRFDLSDQRGRPLDAASEEAIRIGVRSGVSDSRRGHRRERSVSDNVVRA